MSTILITGGTGVIGRHAAKTLAQRGYTVRVLSRRANPVVPMLAGLPNIEFVQGDVRDAGSLHRAFTECDAAVLSHQFQNFPVEDPKRNETFDAVDRLGTINCVRAAQQAGVKRMVYVSGIALSRPNPPHAGVQAKLAAEQAVFGSGIPAVSLRVNVVYAEDDKYFPVLARAARRSPVVPVFGAGQMRCAPIYVGDVAEVIARAVERTEIGGIISVCGPSEVTWKELLLAVAEVGAGRRRLALHIPQSLLYLAGAIGEKLPRPPLSRAAVTFATQFDQACVPPNCDDVFGFRLMDLPKGLMTAFGAKH